MSKLAGALCAALLSTGCVSHSHAEKFNGVSGLRGEPVEYQQTSVWAIHWLFTDPWIGDATVVKSVDEFTAEASKRGATRTNIELTDTWTYWFILPPISFFIQPVNTLVEGQVEGTVGKLRS